MSEAWSNFFQSLGMSLIGAFLGVFIGFRFDRWWEKRQRKKLARDTGQKIAEELGNNIAVLQILIDVLESLPKELINDPLEERWFNPFAKMDTVAVNDAIQHDLLDLMQKKVDIESQLRLMWDYENRKGINILLQRFEEDLRSFEAEKMTSDNLVKRQSRLVAELKGHRKSSMETYDLFKNTTGLQSLSESWARDVSDNTADDL